MFKWFQQSLYRRLIGAFLAASLIPFIVAFGVLESKSSRYITETIHDEISSQTKMISRDIQTELTHLTQEVEFVSHLQIMDDTVTSDIDKRIAVVLEQKQRDWQISGTFFVTDPQGVIIASWNKEQIGMIYPLFSSISSQKLLKSSLFTKRGFIYKTPIYATFDATLLLGYALLFYEESNTDKWLLKGETKFSFLIHPKTGESMGGHTLPLHPQKTLTIEDQGDYIVGSSALTLKGLEGWYYGYAIAKNEAFSLVNDLQWIAVFSLLFGGIIIIVVSIIVTRRIIHPLFTLSQTAHTITQTKNYSLSVPKYSQDEIGTLTDAFNAMIGDIDRVLSQLQRENSERLRLFTHLIAIFNAIFHTSSPQETVETARKELELFTGTTIHFTKNFDTNKENSLPLKTLKDESIGAFIIENYTSFEINQRKFYDSITQMVALQIERIELFENTQAASRAKSSFIANMSHELRTPLNGIIGFSQFLQSCDDLSPHYHKIAGNIEMAGRHLLEMINDILDFAKIEAGKIDVHNQLFNADELMKETIMIVTPLTYKKEVVCSCNGSIGIIKSDPKLLKQILINLLSNAIKFTEKGSVTLTAYCEQELICWEVHDTGIGLESDDIQKLFVDFEQIESPLQKKHKGTGLGLSLSRKLATLLSGKLTLSSEGRGKGTTAKLELLRLN